GWDWAPIYLSDLLLDTEYGSVLNQADQMLKGWSECGLVEYHNFPCPPPSRMPFDRALMEQLGADELVFNWNTTGFGVCSKAGDLTLYAMTRTGALPVTYMTPDQDEEHAAAIEQAEDQAYAYYAGLSEPVLARVVQYASVYQTFHAMGVTAPA